MNSLVLTNAATHRFHSKLDTVDAHHADIVIVRPVSLSLPLKKTTGELW